MRLDGRAWSSVECLVLLKVIFLMFGRTKGPFKAKPRM